MFFFSSSSISIFTPHSESKATIGSWQLLTVCHTLFNVLTYAANVIYCLEKGGIFVDISHSPKRFADTGVCQYEYLKLWLRIRSCLSYSPASCKYSCHFHNVKRELDRQSTITFLLLSLLYVEASCYAGQADWSSLCWSKLWALSHSKDYNIDYGMPQGQATVNLSVNNLLAKHHEQPQQKS